MSQAVPIPPRLLRCPALLPGLWGAPGCPCGVSYPPAAPAGSAGHGAGASGTQGRAAGGRARCSGTGRWRSGGEDVGSISAHRQHLQSRFRWDWGNKKGRSHPGRSHPTPHTSLSPAEHLLGPAAPRGLPPLLPSPGEDAPAAASSPAAASGPAAASSPTPARGQMPSRPHSSAAHRQGKSVVERSRSAAGIPTAKLQAPGTGNQDFPEG